MSPIPRPLAARLIPQELIRAKRDGATLLDDEIAAFVQGLTDGSVSEGQAAAFAMAVFFRGLVERECVALTRAMTESGRRLAWPDLGRPCSTSIRPAASATR